MQKNSFVTLHGVHPTAESSDEKFSKTSAVCIIPQSQAPRCTSHCGINNLSSVCFNPKFYECCFSVMPKDIDIDTVSQKLFKESFLLQTFFDKTKSKGVASTKTRKMDIFESV